MFGWQKELQSDHRLYPDTLSERSSCGIQIFPSEFLLNSGYASYPECLVFWTELQANTSIEPVTNRLDEKISKSHWRFTHQMPKCEKRNLQKHGCPLDKQCLLSDAQ